MALPRGVAYLPDIHARTHTGPSRMLSDGDEGPAHEAAEEAAEPAVEAVPRIGREAFSYLEPRPGIDGLSMFRSCASCEHFVPESFFTGALVGSRCSILGSGVSVTDDGYCHKWTPWSSGTPCDTLVCANAAELRRGVPPAISLRDAGYSFDTTTKKQCQACRFFDATGDDPGEKPQPECEMFETLNEQAPTVFDLDCDVKPNAGCSLWRKLEESEGY